MNINIDVERVRARTLHYAAWIALETGVPLYKLLQFSMGFVALSADELKAVARRVGVA